MSKVYVVGHRNPDTDSVCSAIAYADLKNKITGTQDYVPYRAGKLNEETQYVLKSCEVAPIPLLMDVSAQVSELAIRETPSVKSGISIKTAWNMMQEIGVVTLPVVKNRKMEGIITITDIAKSYMEDNDNTILKESETTYKQIAETLDGKIVCGNDKLPVVNGKVFMGVATPEVMEENISAGDLVILGNRYEAQLCAIEMGAGCIIICDDVPVTLTITKLAKDNDCTVISSPHDAFTVSRLIFQSIPIGHVMKKEGLITFKLSDYVDDVKKVMAEKRHRDFPVLDSHNNYVGMISRRSLLGAEKKKVIMVDHNEAKQAVAGINTAEIMEIVDHHRLGSIETMSPVFFYNQPVGCTSTIIYEMYMDAGVEIEPTIAKLMCAAIISDTLVFGSPTCTAKDKKAAKKLAKIADIDIEKFAQEMFFAGSNLSEKTAKELFSRDYKKFSMGEVTFGIGQVSCIDSRELAQVKKKIFAYMKEQQAALGVDMIFFMLTDIMAPGTELLCVGEGAEDLVENAFNVQGVDGAFWLKGVVSRKKQVVPELMMEIAQ